MLMKIEKQYHAQIDTFIVNVIYDFDVTSDLDRLLLSPFPPTTDNAHYEPRITQNTIEIA